MFTNQNWRFQQIHSLACCYEPNYYANKYTYVNKPNARWTSTLGKFSLQKSTIKNINSLSFLFNNGRSYNSTDVQVLSKLILSNLLDDDGDHQYGLELLRGYNLDVDDLEKLIRTNQLSDHYKELYKSKHKTLLTREYNEKYPINSFMLKESKAKGQKIADRLGKIQFNQTKAKPIDDIDSSKTKKEILAKKQTDTTNGTGVGKLSKKIILQPKKPTKTIESPNGSDVDSNDESDDESSENDSDHSDAY
jgi:hypothetical protein